MLRYLVIAAALLAPLTANAGCYFTWQWDGYDYVRVRVCDSYSEPPAYAPMAPMAPLPGQPVPQSPPNYRGYYAPPASMPMMPMAPNG